MQVLGWGVVPLNPASALHLSSWGLGGAQGPWPPSQGCPRPEEEQSSFLPPQEPCTCCSRCLEGSPFVGAQGCLLHRLRPWLIRHLL